ncbi:hypothetical protein E2C01_027043 [Portunus trituberculatus]|uniref:Uncharacterized protein n=1 Tax=Portunus trituberculatus TaxID=210409 RepID=A0A5B7EJU9_PORTR|nr:hypothetical protein [Portunus trituberculatus]
MRAAVTGCLRPSWSLKPQKKKKNLAPPPRWRHTYKTSKQRWWSPVKTHHPTRNMNAKVPTRTVPSLFLEC